MAPGAPSDDLEPRGEIGPRAVPAV